MADTGHGIPPELLPRVFELFVQGTRDLARSEGGLGIGLTLVRTLVEAHGGRIVASSAGAGQGSVFTVYLPQITAAPPRPPVPAAAPAAVQPRRILVVDDNRDAAELCTTLLEAVGHTVRVAHSGDEALAIGAGWPVDVVLLDIGLPGLDGYALAERIRELPVPTPRFIVMSGYGQAHDHDRSRRAGFAAHLVKPVEPDRLLAALASTPPADEAGAATMRGGGS